MNRADYAKLVNYTGELQRTTVFDNMPDYEVGGIYRLGMCWQKMGGVYTDVEDKEFTFIFHCAGCEGYAIDYENLTVEMEYELGTDEDCEGEEEVLVDSDKMFRILSIDGGYVDDDETIYIANAEVEVVRNASEIAA